MDAAGYGLGVVMAVIARLRGGKAFHPHGAVHRARLVVDGSPHAPSGSQLLTEPAEHAVLVRFSRALGLPQRLPDLLGMALRVLDVYGPERHQDFLLVTTIDLPLLHHIFVPARDVQQRPYTSAASYRAGETTFVVGAVPDPHSPRPTGTDELDRLGRAVETGDVVFGLAVAPAFGRFRRVAALHVGERLPDGANAIRFNPFNCGGGLQPAGVVNRLRDYGYPLSQRTWARDR